MKKLFFFLSLILLAGCSDEDFTGSDNIITITRDLASFNKIVAETDLKVNVMQGPTQLVNVRVNDNLQNQLITRVNNNTLTISLESGSYDNATFELDIQMPELERFQLDDNTQGSIVFDLDQLIVEVNGSSELDLEGSAQTLVVRNNDAGEISGFSFIANVVEVDARNASKLEINCKDTLNGRVTQAAEVRYRGQPVVNATSNEAGEIIDAN